MTHRSSKRFSEELAEYRASAGYDPKKVGGFWPWAQATYPTKYPGAQSTSHIRPTAPAAAAPATTSDDVLAAPLAKIREEHMASLRRPSPVAGDAPKPIAKRSAPATPAARAAETAQAEFGRGVAAARSLQSSQSREFERGSAAARELLSSGSVASPTPKIVPRALQPNCEAEVAEAARTTFEALMRTGVVLGR